MAWARHLSRGMLSERQLVAMEEEEEEKKKKVVGHLSLMWQSVASI
jgi:hypothetical protein